MLPVPNDKQKVSIAVDMIRAALKILEPGEREEVLATVALSLDAPADARTRVEAAIRTTSGNITKAALVLGCSRRTLQNHMRALDLPTGKRGRKPKL